MLVRAMQPSEPVLPWVAAEEMRDPQKRLGVVKALHYHTQRGFISIGDIGEVVASMVLLFAFDNAHGPGRPKPITLCKSLESLLPHLRNDLENEVSGDKTLRQLWEQGSVYFNQFVRTELRQVTMNTARRAYASMQPSLRLITLRAVIW